MPSFARLRTWVRFPPSPPHSPGSWTRANAFLVQDFGGEGEVRGDVVAAVGDAGAPGGSERPVPPLGPHPRVPPDQHPGVDELAQAVLDVVVGEHVATLLPLAGGFTTGGEQTFAAGRERLVPRAEHELL